MLHSEATARCSRVNTTFRRAIFHFRYDRLAPSNCRARRENHDSVSGVAFHTTWPCSFSRMVAALQHLASPLGPGSSIFSSAALAINAQSLESQSRTVCLSPIDPSERTTVNSALESYSVKRRTGIKQGMHPGAQPALPMYVSRRAQCSLICTRCESVSPQGRPGF